MPDNFNNAANSPQSPGSNAKAIEAWAQGIEGDNVLVAVLDGGIDSSHPDLKDKILRNFIIEQNRLVEAPKGKGDNTHGTQCAGMIAANGQLRGVAPKCLIVGIEIGQDNEVSAPNFIRALQKARELNAKIINISYSLNGLRGNPDVIEAFKNCIDSGQLICCGTEMKGKELLFPASLAMSGIMVVGECSAQNGLYVRSALDTRISIYAPGLNIETTGINGSRDIVSGSSFSAALVSGTAALLLQANPGLKPHQIADMIIQSGESLLRPPDVSLTSIQSLVIKEKKRLNASAAVKLAQI